MIAERIKWLHVAKPGTKELFSKVLSYPWNFSYHEGKTVGGTIEKKLMYCALFFETMIFLNNYTEHTKQNRKYIKP